MKLSVNGVETFIATGGRDFDSSQPVVVFLHGAGMDRSAWSLHTRWFAHHGLAVLAPDFPGHGLSQGAALTTIADLADWTAADRGGWCIAGAADRAFDGIAGCA